MIPLEQKMADLSEYNTKLEKKLKATKSENKDLKKRLTIIEDEIEELTARENYKHPSSMFKKNGESKVKMIEQYELQLEERDNEIRMLMTQNRNLSTDMHNLERKIKTNSINYSQRDSSQLNTITERYSSPQQNSKENLHRWHDSMPQNNAKITGSMNGAFSVSNNKRSDFVSLADELRTRHGRSPLGDATNTYGRPSEDNTEAISKFKSVKN